MYSEDCDVQVVSGDTFIPHAGLIGQNVEEVDPSL